VKESEGILSCAKHHQVWRRGFSYKAEAVAQTEYHESEQGTGGFRDLFDEAECVMDGSVTVHTFPQEIVKSLSVQMTAFVEYGAWTRSEFMAKWRYLPEQLGVRCWDLVDEWGTNFKGVLTNHVAGAPRTLRLSASKGVGSKDFFQTVPTTLHLDQGKNTFDSLSDDYATEAKDKGSKVLVVAELDDRVKRKNENKCIADDGVDDGSVGGTSLARRAMSLTARSLIAAASSTGYQERDAAEMPSPLGLPAAAIGKFNEGSAKPDSRERSRSPSRQGLAESVRPGKAFSSIATTPNKLIAKSPTAVSLSNDGSAKKDAKSDLDQDVADLEALFPGDPQKVKWQLQVMKMSVTAALGGAKLGRERHTALIYGKEADQCGRKGEGNVLREKAQLLERCERMGLGGFATEPRDSLSKLLYELKDMKADFPTKAKQYNLTRALDITRKVALVFRNPQVICIR